MVVSWPPWWAPVAASALALAMRLLALRYQPLVTMDGTEYVRVAHALLGGHGAASIFSPGYPALVALARMGVRDDVAAATAVSLVCGVALIWPVWSLARHALGDRWAIVPMLAVALHPELARFSAITMSESAYVLALYLGLALAAGEHALGSGFTLGAAYVIRPEGLVAAAGVVARAGLRAWRARVPRPAPALALLGVLALAVPCWLWFRATLGAWTLTPKIAALHAAFPDWQAAERQLTGAPLAPAPGFLEVIRAEGPGALRRYPANAAQQLAGLMMLWPWPLLGLSAWGLLRRRGVESLALLPLLVMPLLGLSLQPRFALAALPALAILATVPLAMGGRVWRTIAVLLWMGGAVACAWANVDALRTPFDGWFASHAPAGRWLGRVAEPGAVVMDRKPFVAFYAARPWTVLPDAPYDTLLDGAVRTHVRYLVLDQSIVDHMRPQLRPLLYDPAFRAGERRLQLLYVGGSVDAGVAIFRVLQPGERRTPGVPFIEPAYARGLGGR